MNGMENSSVVLFRNDIERDTHDSFKLFLLIFLHILEVLQPKKHEIYIIFCFLKNSLTRFEVDQLGSRKSPL